MYFYRGNCQDCIRDIALLRRFMEQASSSRMYADNDVRISAWYPVVISALRVWDFEIAVVIRRCRTKLALGTQWIERDRKDLAILEPVVRSWLALPTLSSSFCLIRTL